MDVKSLVDHAMWWNEGAYMYLGRMGDNKGVQNVINAWLRLYHTYKENCPDLWLTGGSPDEILGVRASIQESELLHVLEARGRIRWWGYLDSAGVSALLLKTRVLIMHSAYEPGGRVVLEAMSQGVPVIATQHGFAIDLIQDWVSGFIVSYGDLELLAERMAHFLLQPLLTVSMGYSAKQTSKLALSDWAFYKKHADLYSNMCWNATPTALGEKVQPTKIIWDNLPRGLVGRYPFPSSIPDTADVEATIKRELLEQDEELSIEPLYTSGHSLLWIIKSTEATWIAKHSYTIFIKRPLWDRGYKGLLFKHGVERRIRNKQASLLPSFVSILADDEALGIQISKYYPNAFSGVNGLDRVILAKEALELILQERVPYENEARLRDAVHQSLFLSQDLDVLALRIENEQLQNVSLRIALRILALKLANGRITIPTAVFDILEPLWHRLIQCVEKEDKFQICLQHGDFSMNHLLITPEGIRFIDGEAVDYRWWGRDQAFVIAQCRDKEIAIDLWIDRSLDILCKDNDEKSIVLMWCFVEALYQIARSLSLKESVNEAMLWFRHVLAKMSSYIELNEPKHELLTD